MWNACPRAADSTGLHGEPEATVVTSGCETAQGRKAVNTVLTAWHPCPHCGDRGVIFPSILLSSLAELVIKLTQDRFTGENDQMYYICTYGGPEDCGFPGQRTDWAVKAQMPP